MAMTFTPPGIPPTHSASCQATPLFVFMAMVLGSINERLDREYQQRGEEAQQDKEEEEFDVVVVGGGSSGCVIANRVSKMAGISVLLLERGGTEPKEVRVPGFVSIIAGSHIAEYLATVPEPENCNGVGCTIPVPYVLGGGSSINGMMAIRGSTVDYDMWANITGDSGWGFDSMLRYFKRAEKNLDPIIAWDTEFHSTSGPQPVSWQRYRHPSLRPLDMSLRNAGLNYRLDVNSGEQLGRSFVQTTTGGGERWSTYRSYLEPALARPNLRVKTFAKATKVIFDRSPNSTKPRAVGVEYVDAAGKVRVVKARKQVVLTAGALHTPQILQLSGIGPAERLQALNVSLVADLPAGEGLQDHPRVAGLEFVCGPPLCVTDWASRQCDLRQYNSSRTGPLSEGLALQLGAWIRTNVDPPPPLGQGPPAKQPDLQILYLGLTEQANGTRCAETDGWRWNVVKWTPAVLHPRSRGSVFVNASDPLGQPIVKLGYFTDPEGHDLKVVVEGLKLGVAQEDFLAARGLKLNRNLDSVPAACRNLTLFSDEYLECLSRATTTTLWHWVGTARMGSDSDQGAVVDSKLLVKHVERLRVADASVMPTLTSGNTNIPTIMIAERAADLILEELGATTT